MLQKGASRKQRGSSNWEKAQHRVANLHEHIANCRQDFFYKLAHRLCNRAGIIFVEDLNCIAWAKGLFWKQMLDASFGEFFRILEWFAGNETYCSLRSMLPTQARYAQNVAPIQATKNYRNGFTFAQSAIIKAIEMWRQHKS